MNFKDHWVTDSEGRTFIFTVEMQRALSEAGLPVEADNARSLPKADSPRSSGGRSGRAREDVAPKAPPAVEIEEPATIQIDPRTGKYLGRMKWYNPTKGYGFIARGGGEDIFFHKSSVASDPEKLEEGCWVLYDVEERRKGLEAADVEVYEGDMLE